MADTKIASIFAICAILLLSGCAGYGEMVKTSNPGTVSVTWIQQRPMSCGAEKNAIGCAHIVKDGSRCTIEVAEDAPDYVIAHEFKHCFGFVHKK